MDFLNKDTARDYMNQLGKQLIPFFFIIDFEMEAIHIFNISDGYPEGISYCSEKIQFGIKPEKPKKNLIFIPNPIAFENYNSLFCNILNEINRGNSFLVNLTLPTPIHCNSALSEIYKGSSAKYKLLVNNEFVVFSPETFVIINNGRIYSHPMKGTIDATIPGAADILMNNPKEIAEHNTIVDLIRNDLSMVAKNVEVTNFRYIKKINTNTGALFQVSSEISGELPENYNSIIGNIIFTLLPAGSVTGAPKPKTVEIIRSVENSKRGYYTGICGYFDGVYLESAVMIRYIENINGTMVYRSGGGITSQSKAMDEYNELIKKVYVPIS